MQQQNHHVAVHTGARAEWKHVRFEDLDPGHKHKSESAFLKSMVLATSSSCCKPYKARSMRRLNSSSVSSCQGFPATPDRRRARQTGENSKHTAPTSKLSAPELLPCDSSQAQQSRLQAANPSYQILGSLSKVNYRL